MLVLRLEGQPYFLPMVPFSTIEIRKKKIVVCIRDGFITDRSGKNENMGSLFQNTGKSILNGTGNI
jgi:hypothetical protein